MKQSIKLKKETIEFLMCLAVKLTDLQNLHNPQSSKSVTI